MRMRDVDVHAARPIACLGPLLVCAIVLVGYQQEDTLDSLSLVATTALEPAAPHVQGIDVEGATLWISAVDATTRKGVISRHDLRTGKLLSAVDVQDGDRYHPGGIQLDGDFVWVPVAEYKRASTSWIQKRNRITLALVAQFAASDHIGCVAVGDGVVWGGNWDSTHLYRWRTDGTPIDRRENPTGTRYQDLKFVGDYLIGSGLRSKSEGAIDWLDPGTLNVRRRVLTGSTERGVPYTNEGMTVRDGTLYLLPEDAPSRLFAYRLH